MIVISQIVGHRVQGRLVERCITISTYIDRPSARLRGRACHSHIEMALHEHVGKGVG